MFLRKTFEADTCYGCTRRMLDSIMAAPAKTDAFAHGNDKKFFFWFAKAVEFVHINHRHSISVNIGVYDIISCCNCELKYKEEMTFVQWFEVLDSETLPLDKIDSAFECAREKCQQIRASPGQLKRLRSTDL